MNSRYMLSFILLVLTSSVPALAMEQRQRGALRRPLLAEEMVGLSADSAADAADISGQEGASVAGSADDGAVVVPDAASRQLEAQTPATSKKGFLSRCFGSIGNCYASCKNGCASAAKKCWGITPGWMRKVTGLAGLAGVNYGFWELNKAGRSSALLFFSLITGRGANEITRPWDYYVRLLAVLLSAGAWATETYFFGTDIDTIRNAIVAWGCDCLFDRYAEAVGREHNFSRDFRRWPKKVQQLFITGVRKLVATIRDNVERVQIDQLDDVV